jgi:glycosyltransferase involved in cell wall biosynthesis
MKIVVAHNFYQHPGGEDRVFANEVTLLEGHGHSVRRYTLDNRSIGERSRIGVLRDTFWNRKACAEVGELVRQSGAEIVHFHNTFPLMSPAAYYGARRAGAAVVQTLHNYRLICPTGFLHRGGKACEDCLAKRLAWPAALHGCYRDSRVQSAATAAMVAAHRAMGTWTRAVDLFVAPTQFARRKLVEGGLPAEKIVAKANFVHPDPGLGSGEGGYAVVAGRLTAEKGVGVLLDAWSRLREPLRLLFVGDGPEADAVRRAAAEDGRIELVGWQSPEEVCAIVGRAACLVMPSLLYETFGLTIAEAMARGTPVIASRLGAMAEAVDDGRSGFLFDPGSGADLADKVQILLSCDPSQLAAIRRAARETYEERYAAEPNYRQLMSIYERALATRRAESTCYPAWECKA